VAAGRFGPGGQASPLPLFRFNKLRARRFGPTGVFFILDFADFSADRNYVVKGTVITASDDPAHVFEVVPSDDARVQQALAQLNIDPRSGIVVRVMTVNNEPSKQGFMVEISQFTPD
jgi:hypothetical protein